MHACMQGVCEEGVHACPPSSITWLHTDSPSDYSPAYPPTRSPPPRSLERFEQHKLDARGF